jgi:hypothetical protein
LQKTRSLLLALLICCIAEAHYPLSTEPVDVVIPCAEKDLETLEFCIDGIKKNGSNIRRVIVVSARPLTTHAEWFDEALFPFTPTSLAIEIFKNKRIAASRTAPPSRIGWIYQQLLKLYAHTVIPNLSSNLLILDADTIFLKPVTFVGENGEGLYNVAEHASHKPYFDHASRCIPGLTRKWATLSGITHHMLFQKAVVADLLETIEKIHKKPAWKAICRCIDQHHFDTCCMSEYELYFNFVFSRTDQMKIRPLHWKEISDLRHIGGCKRLGYDYVSNHSWMRAKTPA